MTNHHQIQAKTSPLKPANRGKMNPSTAPIREPLPLVLQRAQSAPTQLTPSDARALQQALGNQAVGNLAHPSAPETADRSLTSLPNLIHQNTNVILNRPDTKKPDIKNQDAFFRAPTVQRNGDKGEAIKQGVVGTGETADFISAVGEGLKEASYLQEGSSMLTGGDLLGGVGGMVGGTKDMMEARESETSVGALTKFLSGASGFMSGGLKAAELVKDLGMKAVGETLELASGGFKAASGVVNAGYAEVARQYVKEIAIRPNPPVIKEVANDLWDIIWSKEKSGAFDASMGGTDVAATLLLSPLYKAMAAVGTKAIGSDSGWNLLSKTGMVSSSEALENENKSRVSRMKSKALEVLRQGEKADVKNLHYYGKTYAADFATELVGQIGNLSPKSKKKPWYQSNLK